MNNQASWVVRQHKSGTVYAFWDCGLPWYHIGRLPEDTENQGGRFQIACELVEWLNGGLEPWWLDFVKKLSNDKAVTPHGCNITATSTQVDYDDFKAVQTKKGELERFILIQALLKKARPERTE